MKRALRPLLILACYALGVVMVLVPWSPRYWDGNSILQKHPELAAVALNPYFRGAVSGLGVLDILIAIAALRRRTSSEENPLPARN
jgi:pilus assembly protein TadC